MKKVVAVTGGFGTLGAAVGRAFVGAGWQVALIDVAAAPAASLRDEFGAQLLLGGVDLSNLLAAGSAFDSVIQHYGRFDALINVAGGFRWETMDGGDLATWDAMYQMNVRTTATASKAALPHLAKARAARIVNVASASAVKAAGGMGAYAASKAGVMRLTEALSEEHKATGMTVNAVLPGMIDTAPNRREMPDADFDSWVKPADIAGVIVFLASEAACAVTGALIPVTGKL